MYSADDCFDFKSSGLTESSVNCETFRIKSFKFVLQSDNFNKLSIDRIRSARLPKNVRCDIRTRFLFLSADIQMEPIKRRNICPKPQININENVDIPPIMARSFDSYEAGFEEEGSKG